jgi:hypothetical protein
MITAFGAPLLAASQWPEHGFSDDQILVSSAAPTLRLDEKLPIVNR